MKEFQEEHQTGLMLLRIAVVFSFTLGAFGALLHFVLQFWYWSIAFFGTHDPAWVMWWQEVEQNKQEFLLWNIYNILLWNAVIVFTIWLFRFYDWARRFLGLILGFDMVFTVANMVWMLYTGELNVVYPGITILSNTLQVGVIVLLSHPEVIRLTKVHTAMLQSLKQDETDSRED
jgi:hypothetical protein